MQLTKNIENEILKVYDTWLHSYLNGDVKTYDSYFDDAYHFIGSTNNEEFLTRKATTKFFEQTTEQLAGKTDLRNETKTIELFGNLVFITHAFDAWFLNGEDWTYYSRFRFSSVMQKKEKGWKFIYQHFSTPDSKTDEGETIGFDKVNLENQELREAIKRRTFELEEKNRELEVEGALERIRAQAVAMKQSSDLLDIVVTMRKEFIKLGHEAHYFWHMMWLPETYQKAMTSGDGTKIGFVMELPRHIHGDIPQLAKWEKSKKPTAVHAMDVDDALDYVHKMVTLGDFKNIDPQAPTEDDIRHIGGLTFIMARTSHGEIGYSLPGVVKNPPKEDIDILVKFAGAFDLAHQRFIDLLKAEKQARETQIELALEKVRSRSLAVHKSDEFNEVISIVFEKLKELKISATAVGIAVRIEGSKDLNAFVCGENETGLVITNYRLPYFDNAISKDIYKAINNELNLYIGHYTKKEKDNFYKYILEYTAEFKDLPEDILKMIFGSPSYTISMVATKHVVFNVNDFEGKDLSASEIDILKRFSKVFNQAYIRFLDLQKAEAQAREAQIENALEKVRSRTMAMQHSDELPEAANVLFTEVQNLGIPAWSCGYNILSKNKKSSTCIMSSEGEIQSPFVLPLTEHKSLKPWYKAILNNEDFFVYEQGGKDLEEHYDYMQSLPDLKETFQQLRDAKIPLPTFQVNHLAKFTNGFLLFITYERVPEAHDIFKRFGKVFEQTYTRFLDLQKAEAQTRTAQINLAVERVRAKALAMHKSEDILGVVAKLKDEVMALDIPDVIAATIFLREDGDKVRMWDLSSLEENNNGYQIPFDITFKLKERDPNLYIKRIWENPEDYFIEIQNKKDFKRIIAWLREHDESQFADEVEKFIETTKLNQLHHAVKKLTNGKLVIDLLNAPSDEIETILTKMGAAFDLAYKRFEDLQKAEAQTREAQIEAALEKIRSRSLAMHTTDELQEVVALVAEKLKDLGVIFDAGGVILCTYFPDNKDVMHWIAADDFSYSGNYLVPYFENPIFDDAWESKIRGDAYFSKEFSIEDKNSFFEYAFEHSDYKHFPDEFKQHALQAQQHRLTAAWSENSAILIPSFTEAKPSESDADILKRFAKVFEQAYIRFMDLQKAEERARESQIETALERVRARAMAMHESDELSEAAEMLYQEFYKLGITPFSCGYLINEDENQQWKVWMTDANDESFKNFWTLPFDADYHLKSRHESWKTKELFHVTLLEGKENVEHHKIIAQFAPWKLEAMGDLPNRLVLSSAHFTHGHLLIVTGEPLTPEVELILTRFAKVFDQTYIRFLDLKKAEHQTLLIKEEKERLEVTLTDLRATQKQLIQSEKMASLGELTAGIAHEIQNPLNFVNNFSEVSQELINELKEELALGNIEDVQEILNDVIQNLEKINHHGKRADGIVKGMLQHSRVSSAEKEPTDINKLADEYLRLAYHGMRAKDKSFNATLVTDFNSALPKVNIIPQDMGRVILNLLTNAFYAVNDKKQQQKNDYEPTVSIKTTESKDHIEIKVSDNGNGIQKHLLDKIFQPFFTTKPTGQGTGLGLSMSFDIITKGHDGELKVKQKEGVGCDFIISLPIIN